MRIVSGKYKGKRIDAPRKLPVRPTTDMAKEALFNILNNRYYFEDLKVLDLFSGIGSISLEFASRGSSQVTAVDAHSGCVSFLKSTSDKLDAGIKCIRADALDYLKKVSEKYDLIFADPPYGLERNEFILLVDQVMERELLTEEGILVLEHSSRMKFKELPNFVESRKYGGSSFSFFASSASS
jgi:16S rRNA (guanine(966)-N(2))-methyltransferase RsmD